MKPDPLDQPVWRVSLHPSGESDAALLERCTLSRGRTGGPGGQHRNRVATHAELTHVPTGITAQAGERRSAEENKAVALHRLRYALAVEHRTPVPPGEARTALWASRCSKDGRMVCSVRHRDHATLIAEAMDVLAACGWDAARAALRLCCTQSQIVRLLGSYPPALEVLNDRRSGRGQRPLRPHR